MKELYLFTTEINKKVKECLLCLENNKVSHVLVRTTHKGGEIRYNMETPFVECELIYGEEVKDGIFKRGKIFSTKPELKKKSSIRKINNISGVYNYRISKPLFNGKGTNSNGLIHYEQNRTIPFVSTSFKKNDFNQANIIEIYSGINQLKILLDLLNEVFKTIHPSEENMSAYGNNIRNILILSCTEVEAQLKGILKNNIKKVKSKYSTIDYVKLKPILKLNEYIISYSKFPWLQPINPFENWNANLPTKSISWYNNYNSVKHDREEKFNQATLESVLNSVVAIAVLLFAQYGQDLPYWNDQLGNYFTINKSPSWKIDEHYFPPFSHEYWNRKNAIK